MNGNSRFRSDGYRESGMVRADAGAGIEWAREPQTERTPVQVGFDAGIA